MDYLDMCVKILLFAVVSICLLVSSFRKIAQDLRYYRGIKGLYLMLVLDGISNLIYLGIMVFFAFLATPGHDLPFMIVLLGFVALGCASALHVIVSRFSSDFY